MLGPRGYVFLPGAGVDLGGRRESHCALGKLDEVF